MPSRFYGADGIWVYGLKCECLQWFLSAEDLVDWLGESEYWFELDVGLLNTIEFAFSRLRQYARSLYVLNWIFKIIDKVSSCTRKFFIFASHSMANVWQCGTDDFQYYQSIF